MREGSSGSAPQTMRAVLYDKHARHHMRFATGVPVPKPNAGQLLVKVFAASINPVDYKLAKMHVVGWMLRGKPVAFDFSGVVEQVGPGVTEFAPGERVFGNCSGALAEYALTKAASIARLPEGISHAEAASLPVAALTSLQSLAENGFTAGQRVLIVGASGGTGIFGVQIAKCLGASQVVGVCSAANAELVRSLGADTVVDYTKGNEQLLKDLTSTGPLDFCYDCVTSPDDMDYEPLSRQVLKPGSMHVAINGNQMSWTRMFLSKLTGLNCQRAHYKLVLKHDDPKQLAQIAQWVLERKVTCLLDSQYSFSEEQVHAAYDKLKSRRTKGKLVVNIV